MSTVGGDGQPQNNDPTQNQPLSWEGDTMFHIYIHDYCFKRGYHQTAQALINEAGLAPDAQPPINARQGLLFEWWSVFWVLFSAKNNGSGSEEAMAYTQHQQQRQQQARIGPQGQVQRPYMNGLPRPQHLPNGQGPMSNGIVANGAAPPQASVPNGTPGGPFPAGAPHVNGIAGPSAVPPAGAPTQAQNVPQMATPGQRPVGIQQRTANGGIPFQSPVMAHSPQNPGQPANAPPMAHLGPSQSLTQMNRGGMLPPNGPQGPMGVQPAHGRPPSQPASPAPKGGMPTRSPSMSARSAPQGNPEQMNALFLLAQHQKEVMQQLRQEVGIGEKDIPSLTNEEKSRLLNAAMQKGLLGSLRANTAADPSGMQPPQQRNPQMPQMPQPQAQAQGQPSQAQQSQQSMRGNKRNGTPPGPEDQMPRNESSPPDRKRPRRTPVPGEQPQQQTQMPPHFSIPPGPPGGPLSHGMRPIGGFPGQPNMGPMGGNPNIPMQMNPSMGGPQMNPAMMTAAHINMAQYRQSMTAVHKHGLPQMGNSLMQPGQAGSPPSMDGFNADGHPRPPNPPFVNAPGSSRLQPKTVMMPPPSPSMNLAAKNMTAQIKDAGGSADSNAPNGRQDASPHNAAGGHPAAGAPGQPPPGGMPTGGTAPPTPNAASSGMTAPSPSAVLSNSNTPSMAASIPPVPPAVPDPTGAGGLFGETFMSMDDFDSSLFRDNGDINFERDFGAWFNSDNVGLPLE